MGAIAIILARGGSKGVPGKNVAEVGGKPCVAWTIEAARASSSVGRVVVSTDSVEVAGVTRGLDVEVHDRSPELATDTATVDDAAREVVQSVDPDGAMDVIVLLYGNVPVRPAGLIDRAVSMLDSTRCDSVQSYAPVGKHHPWWTARVDESSGATEPWEGAVLNHGVHRRQDLPAAYVPDGGVIALTRRSLLLEIEGIAPGPHAFFGRDRRGVLTGEGEVIDIDAPIDLVIADAVLRQTVG